MLKQKKMKQISTQSSQRIRRREGRKEKTERFGHRLSQIDAEVKNKGMKEIL